MGNELIEPIHFNDNLKEHETDLIIYTEPVGKARPRVTSHGGFAHAYTTKKTKNYELSIKNEYLKKYTYKDMLEGPIEATIKAYFSIPESYTKTDKELMKYNNIKHTKKPDVDNVVKSVLDALNEVAFKDDSQIIKLTAEKYYSKTPRVEIILKEIKYDDSYKLPINDNAKSKKKGSK